MFAGDFFATVAQPSFFSDLVVIRIPTAVVAGIMVMMANVSLTARGSMLDVHQTLVFTMLMPLTAASMMETAPENRVQQHRRDGQEVARVGHAESSMLSDFRYYRTFGGAGKVKVAA